MNTRTLAYIFAACLLTAVRASASTDATMFRVFLKDGTTLVSYGEFARSGDRVVFSMPTSATSAPNPPLHVVDLSADKVDWDRTNRYAESARAARYIATRAEDDYTALSSRVAEALNEIALTSDTARRLTIVEHARKTLADWPGAHYFYRSTEVRQMLGLLDEAIADLRASAGAERFDLSLVAYTSAPEYEPLLPPPTLKEAIEQTLAAARNADSPADRVSLMTAALADLDRNAAALPSDWVAATRAETLAVVAVELETDRAYRILSSRIMAEASRRARLADVRGIDRLLASIVRRDQVLGGKRPDAVNGLVVAVQSELDAARRLQLARDRRAMRAPFLREYQLAIATPMDLVARLGPSLEDIKLLAGSTPASLAWVHRTATRIQNLAAAVRPPDEMSAVHALLVSAAQLADSASRIRREATLSGDMARAWDASSAAAGALMLSQRAKSEMRAVLRRPELR